MGLRALFRELAGKTPELADYNTLHSNTYFTNIRTGLGVMSTIQAVARRNKQGNWDVSVDAMRPIRGVMLRDTVQSWKNVSTKEMEKLMDDFEAEHKCERPANRWPQSFQRVMKHAA